MPIARDAALPPFEALAELVAGLATHGISFVLGGSGLLHALGLVDEVNDWDLLTVSPADMVAAALDALGRSAERAPEHSDFASGALFRIAGGRIDLIVDFRIHTEQGIVAIPATAGGEWRGIPLARADDWLLAYRAMGRRGKAELLTAHLQLAGWAPPTGHRPRAR